MRVCLHERSYFLYTFLSTFLYTFLCTFHLSVMKHCPYLTTSALKCRFWTTCILAAIDDSLYAASPCLNLSGTEESIGDVGIIRTAAMAAQQVLYRPVLRQIATVENLQPIIIDSNLNWCQRLVGLVYDSNPSCNAAFAVFSSILLISL